MKEIIMAEDEEKVVAKTKDSSKIIMIVGVALVVISMVISILSFLTITSLKKSLVVSEEEAVVEEGGEVVTPLSEIDIFSFGKDFIFIFEDKEEKVSNNVVVSINIGYINTEKESEELAATLSSKESIIRDGLESLVKTKSFDDFKTKESLDSLKEEMKAYLQKILGSELIVDVYFNNLLTTSR